MKHTKLLVAGVVVALVLAAFAAYKSLSHDVVLTAGATPGTNYIENYSPAVLYNGGISSQLPIQTTSDITGATVTGTNVVSTATSTFADTVHTSAATTTVKILSTSSTQGGCIQMNPTSTATTIRFSAVPQATTTSLGSFAGHILFNYGTCE